MSVLDQVEAIILDNFPNHKDVGACLQELGASSTSVALLDEGVVSARCYSTVGDDVDTVFQAASISKPVNALATMKLIEEGRFKLSSTIAELLPKEYLDILVQGSPASQKKMVEGITVKQLMSHTSGLGVSGFTGYTHDPVPAMRQILSGEEPCNTDRIRLEALPGQGFSYSGGGIAVLQLILEAVTGKDYSTLMQDLVLGPLEMTKSFYDPVPRGTKNVAKAHLIGMTKCDVDHYVYPELAAAGLWATATDLLKVVQAVHRSLAGEGGLLRPETAKQMLEIVDSTMALSWGLLEGPSVFVHTGQNIGYVCILAGFAKLGSADVPKNTGIAIMTNSFAGDAAYWKVLRAISAVKQWPWPSKSDSETLPTQFWRSASESGEGWKDWKGRWAGTGHSYTVGEGEGGAPVVLYDDLHEIRLLPACNSRRMDNGSYSDFILEGTKLMMSFEENDSGKVTKLRRSGVGSIEMKREETKQ